MQPSEFYFEVIKSVCFPHVNKDSSITPKNFRESDELILLLML